MKKYLTSIILTNFVMGFSYATSQDAESNLKDAKTKIEKLANIVGGIIALIGMVITYIKTQTGEGDRAKSAVISFIGGLIFFFVARSVISYFLTAE